ncbi:hypothetical protein KDX30_20195 [Pseudomonas sp. CDFA 553]|uniref:hypothetical protein n=1 Tax=Pseudomonas quasicaspiana TaxID=2829821 RepID=UPI001E601CFA|nr:hypothetical protein [Pseudomonas quasicaspiana]MCD5990213.1 hypothetical protein [Pseudomonas quasicaspiana]
MKKTLLASLVTLALASQAEAACLTISNPFSGVIPANKTVVSYGPVTIANGPTCRSVLIVSKVRSENGGFAPLMRIEKLENGQWRPIAESSGGYISQVTTAGTFRVKHQNHHETPWAYNGSIAITR